MNIDILEKIIKISILPLRDVVVYPHMVIPLFVGRKKSIQCIEYSMKHDKKILLVTQKKSTIEKPKESDLFKVGTVAKILQMLKLPDGTVKVLVEGLFRAKIKSFIEEKKEYFLAHVCKEKSEPVEEKKITVLLRTTINQFKTYIKLNKKIPFDTLSALQKIDDLEKLADTICSHIPLKLSSKQLILELTNVEQRLENIMNAMESEIDLLEIEKRIRNRVKNQMEKSQRDYYLNEQIKAIQKELGETDVNLDENKVLEKKIKISKMPKDAKKKAMSELQKLKMMSSMSAEATVIRNYIDWILQVPWNIKNKTRKNLHTAKHILDNDHYGLDNIKERILEFLAVQNRTKKLKGPILCLVGPPGVGKTSLGKSIAKATGRKYIRMALGGIKDEAEIRGHRRTYIGSMPGKIIQKIAKVGVKNPLFLLDEIDKMAFDIRIDPVAALLEVLDIEQNIAFNDHYLEIDYDLSDVMFIATANSTNIPTPLLDRMEILRISGYTEDEKTNIAKNYLYDKQMQRNALKNTELLINDDALINIIRYYTRESGVRSLEREISKICRKTVKKILLKKTCTSVLIDRKNLKEYLGVKKFHFGKTRSSNHIGQVTGLAWTEVGGEILTIETACVSGKGKLTYTGSLGKVMKESIQTALTVVRSQAKYLGIKKTFYEKKDVHVHVPEGAIPKDGPSAGIAMCTAIVSCLTYNPVKSNIAMTGEITLSGRVLSIGGLKEKLLAARRSGIKTVIIPKENKIHLEEIEKNIKSHLKIITVETIKEVLILALEKQPYLTKNFTK